MCVGEGDRRIGRTNKIRQPKKEIRLPEQKPKVIAATANNKPQRAESPVPVLQQCPTMSTR